MHLAALMADLGVAVPAVWAWLSSVWCELARSAGTTLVASIWQSAVIVSGLEIALRLLPRISAAHRFAVWIAGFVIAAGLPLVRLIPFGVSATTTSGAAPGVSGAAEALLQVDARWGLAIAILWLCASAIRGAELLAHSIRLRRLWKAAQPVEGYDNLMAEVRDVRSGRVRICTTKILDRPSVIGFWSPRILIPEWLLERLTPGELEQIVLHETEHLRRYDDWTNLVQKLALVAFPLNPGLAWMEHRLCREREMACDEGVVRITKAPRAYAACLTSLAERRLERRAEALSLGAWHRRSELVHRVHGILLRKRGLSRAAAGALLGTVGCALVAGSVEMARCPQLVAFVPERTLAMTQHREQIDALLARENAEQRLNLPSGYHAVQAKAIMPEQRPAQHQTRKSATAPAAKAVPRASAAQVAAAEKLGDRVNQTGEQQWIVLAAWEEVDTVTRSSATTSGNTVSDYTTAATPDGIASGQGCATTSEAQKNSKNAGQGTNQTSRYAVTHLILRVVPANPNSKSAQPEASMRGGWFVIQL